MDMTNIILAIIVGMFLIIAGVIGLIFSGGFTVFVALGILLILGGLGVIGIAMFLNSKS